MARKLKFRNFQETGSSTTKQAAALSPQKVHNCTLFTTFHNTVFTETPQALREVVYTTSGKLSLTITNFLPLFDHVHDS